jgi:hypothetical protein
MRKASGLTRLWALLLFLPALTLLLIEGILRRTLFRTLP